MPVVLLGNHAALDPDGNVVEGEQVTSIHIPEEDTHQERFRTITHEDGLWKRIAAQDAAWVASDDERLARVLSAHFDCPVHDLEEGRRKLAHATRAAELGVKPEDLDPDAPVGEPESEQAGEGELE
jgi:hypothetical protein